MMRGTCFNIWRLVGLLYLGIVSLITACSVTGPDVPESTHTNDYPVSLSASFHPDTRMTVEGTALSWDDDDMVRITAGASDGSIGAAELTLYSVDADDPNLRNAYSHILQRNLSLRRICRKERWSSIMPTRAEDMSHSFMHQLLMIRTGYMRRCIM